MELRTFQDFYLRFLLANDAKNFLDTVRARGLGAEITEAESRLLALVARSPRHGDSDVVGLTQCGAAMEMCIGELPLDAENFALKTKMSPMLALPPTH